jgi:ATP-dependent helicase/nuclease subunit A
VPSLRARTATSWVQDAGIREPGVEPVEVQVVERDAADRPGGRRFGTLVHAMLAVMDLRSVTDDLESTAAVQGKIVGATKEEMDEQVQLYSRAVSASTGLPARGVLLVI